MLPKLEIHFGEEVLHIPQIVMVKNITHTSDGETLKECLMERYKNRMANVLNTSSHITKKDVLAKCLQSFAPLKKGF